MNIIKRVESWIKFVSSGIWEVRIEDFKGIKAFLIKHLKIIILSVKDFLKDNCLIRASGLTYYSMLSIVPVMAMAFGIAKGFGLDKILENQLKTRFEGKEEVLTEVLKFSNSMLETTKGGVVAGVGFVMLLWTVMKLLGNIEESFNVIWKVKTPRTYARKVTDYLSIMLIAPVLVILTSSVTVYISTHVKKITEQVSLLDYVDPFVLSMLKFLPYLLIWMLFSFLYVVMPNTKVRVRSAIVGGIIAGTVYQVVQWVYIKFQIGVASYNTIYGSFAALPMFLLWLQLSWLIVLFGSEIAFANQNIQKFEFGNEPINLSKKSRKLLALLVSIYIIRAFRDGKKPLSISDLTSKLKLSVLLVTHTVRDLHNAGIISEVKIDTNQHGYQPAEDINKLSISKVLDKYEEHGIKEFNIEDKEVYTKIESVLTLIKLDIEKSDANLLLKDI